MRIVVSVRHLLQIVATILTIQASFHINCHVRARNQLDSKPLKALKDAVVLVAVNLKLHFAAFSTYAFQSKFVARN